MKKEKKNSKKAKVRKEKKKQSKEIIPPMKFNLVTASLEIDTDKLKEIVEEEIEDSEIITPEEVRHFIPSAQERTSPVLQRVEIAESLEENVASTPIRKTADTNVMDYSFQGDYSSSANYSAGNKRYEQEKVAPIVLRDRKFADELQQQEMLSLSDEMQSQKSSGRRSSNITAEHIEERHGLPFEKRERKYREFKG